MMAPFTPFLSETLFQALKSHHPQYTSIESVHLCPYPVTKTHDSDTKLERAVEAMQHIILLGRQKRNDVKIKVKTPLSTLTIIHQDQTLLDTIKYLNPLLKKSSISRKYITIMKKTNTSAYPQNLTHLS